MMVSGLSVNHWSGSRARSGKDGWARPRSGVAPSHSSTSAKEKWEFTGSIDWVGRDSSECYSRGGCRPQSLSLG